MDKLLLSAGETARWIGCSRSTLKNYEDDGLLNSAVMTTGNKRLFSANQVGQFIIEQCGGSSATLHEEYGAAFISSVDVMKKLGVSYKVLDSLDRQSLLSPRRRLPLSHKRLYLESDVEKFLEVI